MWLTRRGLDLYGRTLATVRLPVAKGPALALDSLLVVRGWAWAWDPKRRVAGRAAQQATAVAGRRGLWKCGAVGVLTPKQWRTFNYKTSGVTGWAAPGSKAAECKQPNETELFTPNNDPLL